MGLHRVQTYLRRLPEGLDSYPDCTAKASIYQSAVKGYEVAAREGLADELAQLFERPLPPGNWISEVANNALHLAVADVHFPSDDDFVARAYEANQDLFRSPMYRAMMLLISPARVLRGAQSRWNAFHRGTQFDLTTEGNTAEVILTYPDNLHDLLMLQCIAVAFRAAIEGAHGKNVDVSLTEVSPGRSRFAGRWD